MIYRQERAGRDGRPFTLYKLRTMDDSGRVTRPLLRRTGLDELPQLWNVLRGDMALFGPRPEQVHLDERFVALVPGWSVRRAVKPGLLALAQVHGIARGDDRFDLAQKRLQARLDAEQIRGPWLRTRLRILALLPRAIVRGQSLSPTSEWWVR